MSIDAERGIVSAIIRSPAVFEAVQGKLTPDDFSHLASGVVYKLVSDYRLAGKPVDAVTLSSRLNGLEDWRNTGYGPAEEYIKSLSKKSSGHGFINSYIEIIKSNSMARALIDSCQQISDIAMDSSLDADEKLTQARALMPNIDDGSAGGFVQYSNAARKAVDQLHRKLTGEFVGLSSGFSNLDKIITGFEPGTLVIIAGRPSHGKSIYAMDFAHHAATVGQVLVFSFEMTAANLAERGIASLGNVDFGVMRAGKIDDQMSQRMNEAASKMKSMDLWIDDRANISVDQACTRARIMARKKKPTMIVADYLTLMSGKGGNRTEQTGYISRQLKSLAKELDVPVVCVAQLNRGVDNRPDKRPNISDLRDSGEIEQDADVILFTYLHEKYSENTPRKGIGELIVAKQRNGPTGSVFNQFQGHYQRFVPFNGELPPLEEIEEKKSNAPKMSKHIKPPAAERDF